MMIKPFQLLLLISEDPVSC